MMTTNQGRTRTPAPLSHPTKTGVSLVIVLGILLVVSLIILSFVRITHDSQDSAQLVSERLRSEHLLHTALTRAMEDVNDRLANRLFYWSVSNATDLAVDMDCLVSTNGTPLNPCAGLLTPTVLADIPSVLTGQVARMANDVCQWRTFEYGPSGRYAYVVVNLSGFLDANVVGGEPPSDRTTPAELDLSTLLDTNLFFPSRSEHVRYESRAECLRLNEAFTYTNPPPIPPEDVFTVFNYDPDRDVYFTSTNGIGTRPFTNQLQRKSDVTAAYYSRSNIVAILTECGLTNAEFLADAIIDYQDSNHSLSTNWVIGMPDKITESMPLLNEVAIVDNVLTSNMETSLEFWYPFYPPPPTNEHFQFVATISNCLGVVTGAICEITNFDITCFTTQILNAPWIPGSNFLISVELQSSLGAGWTTIQAYHISNDHARVYSLNDPRSVNSDDTNATIGAMNTNCQPWLPGCQGLPIYHPDRAMRNIGELGYIWTGEPWKTLDLTQTNVAALLDRLTVRTGLPIPSHGLVNAGTTNVFVWESLLTGIPIGRTNNASGYSCTTTVDQIQYVAACLANRSSFSVNDSDLLNSIGRDPSYTNFLSTNLNVSADHREDLLRGIVELLSFRHQLYLVVVAAQTLGADGRTMTAERRGLALIWRDGYTGQYFVRNFRRLLD